MRSTHDAAAATAGCSNDFNYAFAMAGLETLPVAESSILDLGAGTGNFGVFLRGQGYRGALDAFDVVSYPGFAKQAYREFREVDLDKDFESGWERRYDVVFACEMAVCLENPRAFLRSVAALLKPGGLAVLSAANPLSLPSVILALKRGTFRCFGDFPGEYPAVITPILPRDGARMMEEAGMKVLHTAFSNRCRISGGGGYFQDYLPFLKGSLFSDGFRVVARRSASEVSA